jgi:hypothetical protein
MKNGPPKRRAPGPDDLRHGAVQIVPANAIYALQVPEQPRSGWSRMRRRDADNGPPGHDEHHGEVRKRGYRALRDPLNGFTCGTSGRGREGRRNRSNLLVHG